MIVKSRAKYGEFIETDYAARIQQKPLLYTIR